MLMRRLNLPMRRLSTCLSNSANWQNSLRLIMPKRFLKGKRGLIQLFRRGRLDRERRFWEIFGTEVAKIRTRRMLEAMTRDGKLHVRRNNLDFNAEAAKAYYLSLDEERDSCCSATSAEKLIIRSGFFRKIWKKRKSAPAISRTTKTAPFSGVRFGIFKQHQDCCLTF